jgi:hypothetical protein
MAYDALAKKARKATRHGASAWHAILLCYVYCGRDSGRTVLFISCAMSASVAQAIAGDKPLLLRTHLRTAAIVSLGGNNSGVFFCEAWRSPFLLSTARHPHCVCALFAACRLYEGNDGVIIGDEVSDSWLIAFLWYAYVAVAAVAWCW